MATTIIAPAFTRDARGHLIAKSGNIIFDFGDLSALFASFVTTPTSASGTAQKIVSIINNVVKFNDGTPDQTLTVQNAMQVLIAGGLLPANATVADFQLAITGKAGKDSTVAGPSNYARALALSKIPASMTEQQYLDSLIGSAGTTQKSGLLASATTYKKGNAVYQGTSGAWLDLKLVTHERAQGAVAMVDADGDLIATGNRVRVTGLGFLADRVYYVDLRDSDGRNTFPVPDPFPAALAPSPTRSYYRLGKTYTEGTEMYVNFNFQAGIDPAAKAANFSGTDFAFLPFGVTPTAAQIRRLIDTEGNYGASLNALRSEGDPGIPDSGYPTPPVRKLVSGVPKNVMLFDIGYNGFHANTLAQWGQQQSGDWLNVFSVLDANQTAPGFIFAANLAGTDMKAVRLYGQCTLMAFQNVAISGNTVTVSDFRSTAAVSGANLVYMCMRLNISADGKTISAKAWKYDPARSLAQQALSEPAGWTGTYTAATPFNVGYVMPVFNNGTFRRIYSAKSNDPAIPAQFDGDL